MDYLLGSPLASLPPTEFTSCWTADLRIIWRPTFFSSPYTDILSPLVSHPLTLCNLAAATTILIIAPCKRMLRAISPEMWAQTKELKDMVKIQARTERQKTQLWWMMEAHKEEELAKHIWWDNHEAAIDWRTILLAANEGANIKNFSCLSHPNSESHCFFYSQNFPMTLEVYTEQNSKGPNSHPFIVWSCSTLLTWSLSLFPPEILAEENNSLCSVHEPRFHILWSLLTIDSTYEVQPHHLLLWKVYPSFKSSSTL